MITHRALVSVVNSQITTMKVSCLGRLLWWGHIAIYPLGGCALAHNLWGVSTT